jgi:hypothetical protein
VSRDFDVGFVQATLQNSKIVADSDATDVSEKIKERLFVVLYRLYCLNSRDPSLACSLFDERRFFSFQTDGMFGTRFADR